MKLSTTMMMNESLLPTGKKAFTLAEVLITLSILGVVAALTIPSLVNRQSDLAAQVKLKKAISNYEDIIGVYMAENEAENAAGMITTTNDTTCANTVGAYFKAVDSPKAKAAAQGGVASCYFTTADGVAWNIDANGNATATDSKNSPRYAVSMWNANNRVNSEGTADGAANLSVLNTTLYDGNLTLIDNRQITGAPLFLKGTSSTALGTFYCKTAVSVSSNALSCPTS